MKKQVPIYLLPEKHEQLKQLAKSKGVTMSALLNTLVDALIKREFKQ